MGQGCAGVGTDVVAEAGVGVAGGDNARLVAVVDGAVGAAAAGVVGYANARSAFVDRIVVQRGRRVVVHVDASAEGDGMVREMLSAGYKCMTHILLRTTSQHLIVGLAYCPISTPINLAPDDIRQFSIDASDLSEIRRQQSPGERL